ncbi:MAG: potassium channel family protein [Pseudomonadota bacterium]
MLTFSAVFRRKPRWERNRIATQDMLRKMLDLLAVLIGLMGLHATAMVVIEGMSVADALWLTVTSATTVGYGDLSAETVAGRIFTTVLIYVAGIALLAQVAGLWFEYRQERRRRMLTGYWSWTMDRHIVFLNVPADADTRFFEAVVNSIRASADARSEAPILLVDEKFPNGLPDSLSDLGVVHVALPLVEPKAFEHACIDRAETIVVLSSDRADAMSDSVAFDLVDRLRNANPAAWIIAEVVDDNHRMRIERAGANAVMRPVRGYPEMMARAILSHRSEHVMETLFNSRGEECVRLEMRVRSKWREIAGRFLEANAGCPVAFEKPDGDVVTNPDALAEIDATAIFALINPEQSAAAQRLAAGAPQRGNKTVA